MRDDQYHRLQALEEKLTEEVLREADPDAWTAPGVAPDKLTQQERGDRYWCKKNAVAVISLAIRVGNMIGSVQSRGPTGPAMPPGEDDSGKAAETLLDEEIAAAEKIAKKLLNETIRKQHKAEFDKHTHGKS